MTEQEWGKVHLGSIVEYNTINWACLHQKCKKTKLMQNYQTLML